MDGTYRQLVSERRMAVNAGVQIIEEDFPLTPLQCACILLAITIGISIFDWKRKKRSAWYDSLLSHARTGWLRIVRHAILTASYNQYKSADPTIESIGSGFHSCCYQEEEQDLAKDTDGYGYPLLHRGYFPALR